jgi:hypothetical protein
MGCIKDLATDIHYIEDLENIRNKKVKKWQ